MPEISVEVSQLAQSTTSKGTVRNHQVLIDRPADKGGEDQGPMGGEVLLLGLGGCFMSNLIAAANARNFNVRDLKAVVRGELVGIPPRFETATVDVYGTTTAEEEFDKIIAIAERGCIVANTLKGAMTINVKRMAAVSPQP